MGPLPAFFYPAFQLMDYGVHSWDIRQGTGRAQFEQFITALRG